MGKPGSVSVWHMEPALGIRADQGAGFPRKLLAMPDCLLTTRCHEHERRNIVSHYLGGDGLLYDFDWKDGWFAMGPDDS
jgi:hypothetical protein